MEVLPFILQYIQVCLSNSLLEFLIVENPFQIL